MPDNEPVPCCWDMTDPAVLAHRFRLPDFLPPYTAVTIFPFQHALLFINDEERLLDFPGLYLLTGERIDSLADAARIQAAKGETIVPWHTRCTLFDTRWKLWPDQELQLTLPEGGKASVTLSICYRVNDPVALSRSGASFLPCPDGSEMRQDDPVIAAAFRQAIHDVTRCLKRQALLAGSAGTSLFDTETNYREACQVCNAALTPLGLQLVGLYLSPIPEPLICPTCGFRIAPGLRVCPACGSAPPLPDEM